MKKIRDKDFETQNDFEIDYDLFSTEEIIKIYNFFQLVEKNNKRPVNKNELKDAYNVYRNILNNKSLEKQYDKKFEEKTGISIYNTIKNL